MRVRLLEIENFRGITTGRVVFRQHTLLIGGNNIGKSTVCEALELVLGPERMSRRPVVDEHDDPSSGRRGETAVHDSGRPCDMASASTTRAAALPLP